MANSNKTVQTENTPATDLSVLLAIKKQIADFQVDPVFPLLKNFPAVLEIKHFKPTKDNQLPLSGMSDLFRNYALTWSFDVPLPLVEPVLEGEDYASYGQAMALYTKTGKPYNDMVASLSMTIKTLDLVRLNANLCTAITFCKSHDASLFEVDDELDLYQLSETTRAAILQVYKDAFIASPTLAITGATINLLEQDPLCSIASSDGIDRIIAVKAKPEYKGAQFGFMSKDTMLLALKPFKNVLNLPTLFKVMTRLNCNLGTMVNSSTIASNLKQLHGIAPKKGKGNS